MKPLGISLEEIRKLMALLDRSSSLGDLSPDELGPLAASLHDFSEKGARQIDRLERYLVEVRKLKGLIDERLRAVRTL
jgi:DNA-binding transcriptional MerR regulator